MWMQSGCQDPAHQLCLFMIYGISCFHINTQRKSTQNSRTTHLHVLNIPWDSCPGLIPDWWNAQKDAFSSEGSPHPQALHLKGQHKLLQRQEASNQKLFEEPSHCWYSSAHKGESLFPQGTNKAKRKRNCNKPEPFKNHSNVHPEAFSNIKNSALKSHSPEQVNNLEVIFSLWVCKNSFKTQCSAWLSLEFYQHSTV